MKMSGSFSILLVLFVLAFNVHVAKSDLSSLGASSVVMGFDGLKELLELIQYLRVGFNYDFYGNCSLNIISKKLPAIVSWHIGSCENLQQGNRFDALFDKFVDELTHNLPKECKINDNNLDFVMKCWTRVVPNLIYRFYRIPQLYVMFLEFVVGCAGEIGEEVFGDFWYFLRGCKTRNKHQ